jgi:hypothetical protein
MRTPPVFANGDRVAMAAAFLRSIMDFSHASASQRGVVTHVSDFGQKDRSLVQVQWDDGHVSKSLNVNLVHADRIHLEPN